MKKSTTILIIMVLFLFSKQTQAQDLIPESQYNDSLTLCEILILKAQDEVIKSENLEKSRDSLELEIYKLQKILKNDSVSELYKAKINKKIADLKGKWFDKMDEIDAMHPKIQALYNRKDSLETFLIKNKNNIKYGK